MKQTASLYNFTVTWEPFLLRPGIPEEGAEKPDDYKTVSKSGHLYKAGQSVGIEFTGKCPRFPNTIRAHAMLEYAKSLDESRKLQNDIQERLFQAYFTDGRYPDMATLRAIANEASMDLQQFDSYMNESNIRRAEVIAIENRQKVQTGVPFFIINGHGAFSGAQDSDTFVKVFAQIAQMEPRAHLHSKW